MSKIAGDNPEKYKEWPTLHAPFINTSTAMYGSHYNRTNAHEQAAKTGVMINDALQLVPQTDAVEAIQRHTEGVEFLDSTQDPVVKVTDERYTKGDLEFYCTYASGRKDWVPQYLMDPFLDLVMAYFDTFGPKPDELMPDQDNAAALAEDDDDDDDVEAIPSLESASSEEQEEESAVVAMASPPSVSNPRKRKRPSASDLTEVLLESRAIKPGDIVSVNPEPSSKDDFWLAKVVEVVNSDKIVIQWLEKTKQNPLRYRMAKNKDEVEFLTLNGYAGGEWINRQCYSIE